MYEFVEAVQTIVLGIVDRVGRWATIWIDI